MEVVPPSGIGQQIGSPQEDEGSDLYGFIKGLEGGPADLLAKELLKGIQGPPYDPKQIISEINAVLTKEYTNADTSVSCDAYMQFNLDKEMLSGFVQGINVVLSMYQDKPYTIPSTLKYTAADQAVGNVIEWMDQYKITDITPLANALFDSIRLHIGSNGDPKGIAALLTPIFTDPNFFTKSPVTPQAFADLQKLAGLVGYKLPDFTLNYLNAYYSWPTGSADDAKLQQDLLTEMRNVWTTGSLATITTWASSEMASFFSQYPGVDLQGAQNLETVLSIPFPELQTQYFSAKEWLGTLTSGTPTYKMVEGLMAGIKSVWPNGTTADLQQWYQTTYGVVDPFMACYGVDEANIQKLYQIANNTTGTLKETTSDKNYLEVMDFLNSVSSDSDDYQLMNSLAKQWYQYGSNPSTDQIQLMTKWARNTVLMPLFLNTTDPTRAKFLGYFDYSVKLSSLVSYLIFWGSRPQAPSSDQQFAIALRSIISGYLQTHPQGTQADFQNYLNANYAKNDFCFQCPGLSPWDVESMFTQIGLQNPHTYSMIDFAYWLSFNGEQLIHPSSGSPDAAAFAAFYQKLVTTEQLYDPAHPDADLFTPIKQWITEFQQTPQWNQLQPASQAVFLNIFGLQSESVQNIALVLAETAQSVVDGKPLDTQVLAQVVTDLKSSIGNASALIQKLQDSADWDKLTPATREALQVILHMLSIPQ